MKGEGKPHSLTGIMNNFPVEDVSYALIVVLLVRNIRESSQGDFY